MSISNEVTFYDTNNLLGDITVFKIFIRGGILSALWSPIQLMVTNQQNHNTIHCSSFVTLCLGSIGGDHVISTWVKVQNFHNSELFKFQS